MAAPPLARCPAPQTQFRTAGSAATNATQTLTIRPSATQTRTQTQPVLRLRGAVRSPGERSERRIQWAEDVVDNEGLGRKSSKVCCIYHAPKASIDESDDESSSDSSSSDSDSGDDGAARPVGGKRRAGGRNKHRHEDECGHGRKSKRTASPNAYEKMPKPKDGGAQVKKA